MIMSFEVDDLERARLRAQGVAREVGANYCPDLWANPKFFSHPRGLSARWVVEVVAVGANGERLGVYQAEHTDYCCSSSSCPRCGGAGYLPTRREVGIFTD